MIIVALATASVSAAGPPSPAYQKAQGKKPHSKVRSGALRGKLEKLSCTLGNEDRQARIAVELIGGRVKSIAYYSKWKPRTCSVHIMRDDAWSNWVDTGSVTVVTLNEEKGAFLIDHDRRALKFLFREIDRERFCGMPGKITGSLIVTRGRDQCMLEGIMDEEPEAPKESEAPKEPVLNKDAPGGILTTTVPGVQ